VSAVTGKEYLHKEHMINILNKQRLHKQNFKQQNFKNQELQK